MSSPASCNRSSMYSRAALTKTPATRHRPATASRISRARSTLTYRGLAGWKLTPIMSAPNVTAISASLARVRPQIFTRTLTLFSRLRGVERLHEGRQRRARIALAQQALAYQKRACTCGIEPANVGGRFDPALRDDECATGIIAQQFLGYRDIGLERMKVAVVDPDEFRAASLRERELCRIMHLDQRRHTKLMRKRGERTQISLGDHRGDQQNAVGAGRARLVYLVRVEDKVLAQQRDVDGSAHRAQISSGDHRGDQQNTVGAGPARLVYLVGVEDKVLAEKRDVDGSAHRAQIS